MLFPVTHPSSRSGLTDSNSPRLLQQCPLSWRHCFLYDVLTPLSGAGMKGQQGHAHGISGVPPPPAGVCLSLGLGSCPGHLGSREGCFKTCISSCLTGACQRTRRFLSLSCLTQQTLPTCLLSCSDSQPQPLQLAAVLTQQVKGPQAIQKDQLAVSFMKNMF